MPITTQDVADLLKASLPDYNKRKVADIQFDRTEYVVMPRLLKKERMIVQGGYGVTRSVRTKSTGTARHVAQYHEDAVAFTDVLSNITQDFRITENSWTIDSGTIALNDDGGDGKQIVNLLKERQVACDADMIKLMETAAFSQGPAASTDKTTPMGLPYWVLKGAKADNAVFGTYGDWNAAAPSGHAAGRGGLLHDRWANWSFSYTYLTRDDCIAKMKRAKHRTGFKNPLTNAPAEPNSGSDRRLLAMNYETRAALESELEKANDKIGWDLSFLPSGHALFQGSPITVVDELDDDTTNPIYMLDFAHLYFIGLKGMFMKETRKPMWPNHNDVTTFVEYWWNTFCDNLRTQAVGYYEA